MWPRGPSEVGPGPMPGGGFSSWLAVFGSHTVASAYDKQSPVVVVLFRPRSIRLSELSSCQEPSSERSEPRARCRLKTLWRFCSSPSSSSCSSHCLQCAGSSRGCRFNKTQVGGRGLAFFVECAVLLFICSSNETRGGGGGGGGAAYLLASGTTIGNESPLAAHALRLLRAANDSPLSDLL